MDTQLAFQIAFPIFSLLSTWVFKLVFDRIKQTEELSREQMRVLNDLRVELPTEYTRKTDLEKVGDTIFDAVHELGTEMKAGMQRLENKIDAKVDRRELSQKD